MATALKSCRIWSAPAFKSKYEAHERKCLSRIHVGLFSLLILGFLFTIAVFKTYMTLSLDL